MTPSEARRESYEELVDEVVDELRGPLSDEVEVMDPDLHPRHPLLCLLLDEGEDALWEHLGEELREQAEGLVNDRGDSGPCCYQFSCPCGNSNNVPD